MDSENRPEPTVRAARPAPAGSSPESNNIGQAMRRVIPHHWGRILGLWVILTACLVIAINENVKPMYESSGVVRIEPASGDLFGQGLTSESFGPFLQTQVELIRSPKVVGAAVLSREVAGTTLLKDAKDPEGELRAHLKVVILNGTYLIRVGLISLDPEDGPKIVNEVIKRYIEVATEWSDRKNRFQITRLNAYKTDLNDRIDRQEKTWLGLAEHSVVNMIESTRGRVPSNDDLTLPQAKRQEVSLEEYRQVRERLFETKMKLIETEALFEHRQAELSALAAGEDPELQAQKRIKESIRKDPEVALLLKEIDQVQRKSQLPHFRTPPPNEPSLVPPSRQLEALKQELRDLIARKQEDLALWQADKDTTLDELNEQIDLLKVRKSAYEKFLALVQVTDRNGGSIREKMALAREDLSTLRTMRMAVEKRIEQLEFDSRGEARIQKIENATKPWAPITDARRKLWAMSPVCVLVLVLGLFLIVEMSSGAATDRVETRPGKPVSAEEV